MRTKVFNEKYETAIDVELMPIARTSNKKAGDIIECGRSVSGVSYYFPVGDNKYHREILTRSFILDMADQIKDIESKTINVEFDGVQF